MLNRHITGFLSTVSHRVLLLGLSLSLSGCAQVVAPQTRNVNIPAPQVAEERREAINERPDSIMYLPLGRDVLMPETAMGDPLPDTEVGPFELRGETLAGALQLILAEMDVPIAFESEEGLSRTITVANLKGKLGNVVNQVCSLADLYCSYEKGALVIKDSQVFTVTVPPVGNAADRQTLLTNIAAAVQAITGTTPVVDASSRTIVYESTGRNAEQAFRYFQRIRSNTALIVYETYIWEVALSSGNTAGIDWDVLGSKKGFKFGIDLTGTPDSDVGTPISIGLPTKGEVNFTTGDVLKFISNYGAVKTISQPQLTVLSGSEARLRVADTRNYVSSITRSVTDGGTTTTSTATGSVDTGFTLEIGSNWDNATVYGSIKILLQEVRDITTFDENPDAIVQLPETTERELETQVRIRPGDSLLIAGLVREIDSYDKTGLGIDKPLIPTSRTGTVSNVELVFLMRPRVIVFTDSPARNQDPAPVAASAPVVLPRGAQQSEAVPLAELSSKGSSGDLTKEKPPLPVAESETPPAPTPVIAEPVVALPPVEPVTPEPLPVTESPVAPRPKAASTVSAKSEPAPVAPESSSGGVSDVIRSLFSSGTAAVADAPEPLPPEGPDSSSLLAAPVQDSPVSIEEEKVLGGASVPPTFFGGGVMVPPAAQPLDHRPSSSSSAGGGAP